MSPLSTADTTIVYNPFTQKEVATLPLVTDQSLQNMVRRLEQLHQQGAPPYAARKQLLQRFYQVLHREKELLIAAAVAEGGKPLKDTTIEMARALNAVEIGIQSLFSSSGQGVQIPMGLNGASGGRIAYTHTKPIGPVLAITAFNHPINQVIHPLVSAIVAGCPLLVKPAKKTPLTCQKIFLLLKEALKAVPQVPPDYCQWMLCSREQLTRLVADPTIALIFFVGSADVGWALRTKIAPGTRLNLEHGGTATLLIGAGQGPGPTRQQLEQIATGAFYHAGQVCVSTQALYLPESLKTSYVEGLVQQIQQLKVGDPTAPTTAVGPMITPEAVERAHDFVQQERRAGAQVATGGVRYPRSSAHHASCYPPTLLVYPKGVERRDTEELFAPILCLYTYDKGGLLPLVKRLNHSRFSFQAALFTDRIQEMVDVATHLEQKTLIVNDHTAFRVDWMPFGGAKASGLGRSGIPYMVQEMREEHLVVIKRGNFGE